MDFNDYIKGENVMALIKCPECGKEISNAATTCIHCGYPISKHINTIKKTNSPSTINNSSTYVPPDLRKGLAEGIGTLPYEEQKKLDLENLKIIKNKSLKHTKIAIAIIILIFIIYIYAFTRDFNDPQEVLVSLIFTEILPIIYLLANAPDASKFTKEYKLASTDYEKYCEIRRKEFEYAQWYGAMRAIKNAAPTTCPRCGSRSITTGARGVNFTMGLIGASKTVNRCSKCGYTWAPKK